VKRRISSEQYLVNEAFTVASIDFGAIKINASDNQNTFRHILSAYPKIFVDLLPNRQKQRTGKVHTVE